MLPAPTVAAAGTLAFHRLRERASCRCSLPFGPILSDRDPPVRFAVPVRPASRRFLFGSAFGYAAPAGSGRMGLAVAGAVAACCALPRFGLLRACFLPRSFGQRSLGRRACAPCLRTDRPAGRKRALPHVLACCPSRRFCWIVPPVFRPSALPHPPCFGTPFRHPEPVFPVCNPPFPKRASARRNRFQCKLFSPVRSENFRFHISALRPSLHASFPSRQDRCCASFLSRTSAKMRSYPQAAQGLVDNFASREKGLRF